MDRLPALPLIVNDPYFSLWAPGDTLTEAAVIHWSGQEKPLSGHIIIDGQRYVYLGKSSSPSLVTRDIRVTPTATTALMEAAGVSLSVRFWAPALMDDLDALSTPITYVDFSCHATDGCAHTVALTFTASEELCYEGRVAPPLHGDTFRMGELYVGMTGQSQQHVLGHSGDHITIDWGYLYMASPLAVTRREGHGLSWCWNSEVSDTPVSAYLMLGYDPVAAVNYFGVPCKPWGLRDGSTLPQKLTVFAGLRDDFAARCAAFDESLLQTAARLGGEDYRLLVSAAYRHTLGAHVLIATPEGEMALLSKENDSNGCIGTVDVSYPSTPLFLRFCPELVNALCRPVLHFASLPVWEEDFAPHDVGRYPYATGQVYAARRPLPNGQVPLPFYLYPAGCDLYDTRYQMPVEECGNMLIMLETAVHFGASDALLRQYAPLLEKWVRYLETYGEDPGEQLCTDDFAGHLARNVNLSAKAVIGIACYARILARLGHTDESRTYADRAKAMAESWLLRAAGAEATALTFDGIGWSMKYNLIWDRVLSLHLLPEDFYRRETESYLARMHAFGLPLDSRADYTKSDWLVWTASMSPDIDVFRTLIHPLAEALRHTPSRVPFSDWYDTRTGRYVAFIGRSVQGGIYMPLLLPAT